MDDLPITRLTPDPLANDDGAGEADNAADDNPDIDIDDVDNNKGDG